MSSADKWVISSIKPVMGLTVLTILGSLVSILYQSLIAHYFGANEMTDAFFMARSSSDLLQKFMLLGQTSAVFMPIFASIYQKDKSAAWDLTSNTLNTISLLSLLLCFIAYLIAKPFVELIAPGFNEQTKEVTILFLRIILPANVLWAMSIILTSVLQYKGIFIITALAQFSASALMIIILFIGKNWVGIVVLPISLLISSLVQFLFLLSVSLKEGMKWKPKLKLYDPTLREVFSLLFPFLFSLAITQVSIIIHNRLASSQNIGDVSLLNYAIRIYSVMSNVLISIFPTVFFPTLLNEVSSDTKRVGQMVRQSIKYMFMAITPIIIIVCIASEPIIQIFFHGSSLSNQSYHTISNLLSIYSAGILTMIPLAVIQKVPFALKNTKINVAVSMITSVATIVINLILVSWFKIYGLAWTATLIPLIGYFSFRIFLKKTFKTGAKSTDDSFLRYIVLIVIVLVLSKVSSVIVRQILPNPFF
ncbi:MAG: oligosaccharide flippase family protein [Bacteroidetes bacterium]|nr:oligosaccharide flippase family protein [Bacteroidota bacterium]